MRRVLWLVAVAVLFGSTPALAASIHFYTQIKTSILPIPEISDKTFTLDVGFDEFDLVNLSFSVSSFDLDVSMPGLGDGTVPPTLMTNLLFDPSVPVDQVLFAGAFAVLLDDDFEPEQYALGINGQQLQMGGIDDFFFLNLAFEVIVEDVEPLIQEDGDSVDLAISSLPVPAQNPLSFVASGVPPAGDFTVLAAGLVVLYEGASAVPEPTAAVVFALGAIVMSRVPRRRR